MGNATLPSHVRSRLEESIALQRCGKTGRGACIASQHIGACYLAGKVLDARRKSLVALQLPPHPVELMCAVQDCKNQ